MIKNIMFDMDGTLIDCYAEVFVPVYVKAIRDAFGEPLGDIIAKVAISGAHVMVKNDGLRTNKEAFMEYARSRVPMPIDEFEKKITEFYADGYKAVASVIRPKPLMAEAVKVLKARGLRLVVTTNPVFPLAALLLRLRWGGHDPAMFDFVTSYETSSYAKPSSDYYTETLRRLSMDPANTLIVGNDEKEDVESGKAAGMLAYYLTDTPIPCKDARFKPDFSGSSEDFLAFARTLDR